MENVSFFRGFFVSLLCSFGVFLCYLQVLCVPWDSERPFFVSSKVRPSENCVPPCVSEGHMCVPEKKSLKCRKKHPVML